MNLLPHHAAIIAAGWLTLSCPTLRPIRNGGDRRCVRNFQHRSEQRDRRQGLRACTGLARRYLSPCKNAIASQLLGRAERFIGSPVSIAATLAISAGASIAPMLTVAFRIWPEISMPSPEIAARTRSPTINAVSPPPGRMAANPRRPVGRSRRWFACCYSQFSAKVLSASSPTS